MLRTGMRLLAGPSWVGRLSQPTPPGPGARAASGAASPAPALRARGEMARRRIEGRRVGEAERSAGMDFTGELLGCGITVPIDGVRRAGSGSRARGLVTEA